MTAHAFKLLGAIVIWISSGFKKRISTLMDESPFICVTIGVFDVFIILFIFLNPKQEWRLFS